MTIQSTAQVRSANTVSVSRQAKPEEPVKLSPQGITHPTSQHNTNHRESRTAHTAHLRWDTYGYRRVRADDRLSFCARLLVPVHAHAEKMEKDERKDTTVIFFILVNLEIICNFAVKPRAHCVNKRGLAQTCAERAAIRPRTTCGVVSVVGNSLDRAQNSQFLIV